MLELMQEAAPDLSSTDEVMRLVRIRLAEEPDLVEVWQSYSYDKRTGGGPYLDDREVGTYKLGREQVVRYDDRIDACADYITREAVSMLG
jgi:hypothetical protein